MITGMDIFVTALRLDLKSGRGFFFAILLASLKLSNHALADDQDNFRFHGQPVHPLLIRQFEPWISDERPPITVEVNLSAAWDSNQFADAFKTNSDGSISVNLSEGGSYAYRHLGKLDDGTHVLRTFYLGGGSGSFEALLFVRFQASSSYLADGVRESEQLFLRVVRRYPLGDRDDAEVTVKAGHVVVGKSRYRSEPVVLNFAAQTPSKSQKKESP